MASKNDYVILDSKQMGNIWFAEPFMMRGNQLKLVTPNGNIISKENSLRLSRYMRISNVIETSRGQLRFDVPERWLDPFEKLFYKYPITIDDKDYYVVCLCFIYDVNDGEESLWHVHGNIKNNCPGPNEDAVVRATFNIQELCKKLAKAHPDVSFYFAPIDYSLSRDQILKRYQIRKNTPYSNINEFINDMLVKRKAFSYEHEVRLFAVSETPFDIEENSFCIFKLNNKKPVISKITLPPIPITAHYNSKTYHSDLEKQYKAYAWKLHQQNCNIPIRQSRLYDIIK